MLLQIRGYHCLVLAGSLRGGKAKRESAGLTRARQPSTSVRPPACCCSSAPANCVGLYRIRPRPPRHVLPSSSLLVPAAPRLRRDGDRDGHGDRGGWFRFALLARTRARLRLQVRSTDFAAPTDERGQSV